VTYVTSPPTPINDTATKVATLQNGLAPSEVGSNPSVAEQVGHLHALSIVAAQVPGAVTAPAAQTPGAGPLPTAPSPIQLTPGDITAYLETATTFGIVDGICYGPDGNIWGADQVGTVWQVTPQGVGTAFTTGVGTPQDICTGPDGNLWVADSTGNILQVTPAGVVQNTYAVGGAPNFICVGPDGALWWSDNTDNILGRITTAGVFTTFALTGIISPYGICSGPDQRLWLSGASVIAAVTTSGVVTAYPCVQGGTPFGFSGAGLCTGPDGNIWVCGTTSGEGQLLQVTPSGVMNQVQTGLGGPLNMVCVGPDGALWAAAFAQNVYRFSVAGVLLGTPAIPGIGTGSTGGCCAGPAGTVWFGGSGNPGSEQNAMFAVAAVYAATHASNPALPHNPPVSAVIYQNNTGGTLRLRIPVYATTLLTAGTVTLRRGAITPPSALSAEQVPGSSTAAAPFMVTMTVPPLWYWSLTVSGATIAAAQVADQLVT